MKHISNPTERARILKITMVISAFLSMIFLDQTGVSVTLPSIQKELAISSAAISWSMTAYFLGLSAFLLFFARLSDAVGIKNIFCTGITLFMLASIGCGAADSAASLIASRTLQGIGASMGYATYLLIFNYQVPPQQRGKVLGTSAAFGAIFLALGPLIGGYFSTMISWRYLFWLNVPICLACLYFAITACNKDENKSDHWLADKSGLVIYLAAIIGLIFPLMEGVNYSWTNPFVVASILGSLFLFALFAWHEKYQREPLIEIDLFKNKIFSASIMILFGNYACVTTIVFWALWLQQVLGYSALKAGIALLPAGIPYIITSKVGGALYDRHGARLPLMIGSIFFLAGFMEMTLVLRFMEYKWFMIGMLLMGIGWGFVRPCAILSALNSVPPSHKSMATGMISTMRQLGAAVGFAATYAVISTTQYMLLRFIISSYKLDISVQQLNSIITHASSNQHLMKLLPMVKMANTHALAIGMAVIGILALLNLLLVMKYIGNTETVN